MNIATTTQNSRNLQEQQHSSQLFWARYFTFYDSLNLSRPYRQMIQRQTELLAPSPGNLILDAGTGTGNLALALSSQGADVIGIDFSEEGLARCRNKYPTGDFRFGDLSQPLDFESDYFNGIGCSLVLYTFKQSLQEKILREFFRVLKPGGSLVLTTIVTGFSIFKIYTQTIKEIYEESDLRNTVFLCLKYSFNSMRFVYTATKIKRRENIGEYNFSTRDELLRMITEAGFEIKQIEPSFASQCLTVFAKKPS